MNPPFYLLVDSQCVKFSQKDFEEGFMDRDKTNVLKGVQAPQPLGKDLYDRLIERSNDIVVIVNLLMVIMQLFRKKRGEQVTPEEAWAVLVSSDLAHLQLGSPHQPW